MIDEIIAKEGTGRWWLKKTYSGKSKDETFDTKKVHQLSILNIEELIEEMESTIEKPKKEIAEAIEAEEDSEKLTESWSSTAKLANSQKGARTLYCYQGWMQYSQML